MEQGLSPLSLVPVPWQEPRMGPVRTELEHENSMSLLLCTNILHLYVIGNSIFEFE